jgi:hypothetical protein
MTSRPYAADIGCYGRGGRGAEWRQQLNNPTPQVNVLRALLRAWHEWASADIPPPSSRYSRIDDGTSVSIEQLEFPALAGLSDPRLVIGPARLIGGKLVPLSHLVPQVDRDGNDIAGIRSSFDGDVDEPVAQIVANTQRVRIRSGFTRPPE